MKKNNLKEILLFAILISTCLYYSCSSEDTVVPATCIDGVMNQGETNIDCGGPCTACISCTDGIKNQGETGVDCGGPCQFCSSGSFSTEVNGLSWISTYTVAIDESTQVGSPSLLISGEIVTLAQEIKLVYQGPFAPGTYPLTSASYVTNSLTDCVIQSGNITFSNFDTSTKTISGMFDFTCQSISTGDVTTITQGVFYNIVYN